jgi:hypothetical protein
MMACLQGSTLLARRRLDNEYDLECGHVDVGGDVCHGPCGAAQKGPLVVAVDASGSPEAAPPTEHAQLFLFAPEGFVQIKGVWQRSQHAQRNERYGGRATYRRPVRSSANGAMYAWNLVEEYPYDVRCPWCGETRTLRDRDELRLVVDNVQN